MIHEILKRYGARGAAHGLSMKQLADLTGLPPRYVRAAVKQERGRHIICGDENGYYRPACRDEIEHHARRFQRRLVSAAYSSKLARRYLKRHMQEEGGVA